MLLVCGNVLKILPVTRFELYSKENCLVVKTDELSGVLLVIKNHFKYQFKVLTCISGVDYPENFYRFQIIYELLSLKFNARVRLKILVDELTPLDSIENIFPAAGWWECEIWDMFGVFFLKHSNLTRLLTDYGFKGYPLRKDFPLSGFVEARYNVSKRRVIYEKIELAQEYRTFEFISPWANFNINEKVVGKR